MANSVQRVGTEFLVNNATLNSQLVPVVTGLTDGNFVVAWMDQSGQGGDTSVSAIKAQMFTASGARIGSEFLVNTATTNYQRDPAISGLSDGHFVVVWEDASGQLGDASGAGLVAQIFDAAGAKIGTEFLVNTATAGYQAESVVTGLNNGHFVVSWTDPSNVGGDTSSYGIKSQIFDASGSKVGAEFLVNTTTTNFQIQPTIAGLGNGGFVVGWTDSSSQGGDTSGQGIKAQIFDTAGATIGTEFQVNTTTTDTQERPTITGLSNGTFVASWVDDSGEGGDASNSSIKAQIFTASGDKIGTEFLVNTSTTNFQVQPTITGLSSGNFVISWIDGSGEGGDASNYGIKAQVFSPTGVRIGGEFLVNTSTTSNQLQPSIAALADGSFVVSWMDLSGEGGDTSGYGIKAQIFALNSAPATTPVVLAAAQEDGVRLISASELLVNAADDDAGDVLTVSNLSILSGVGTLISNGDGTWSFTPVANDDSGVVFQYDISDGVESVNGSASMDLSPVNDAPNITGILVAAVAEGGSYALTAADLGFDDPDDDASGVSFTVSNLVAGIVLVEGIAATSFTSEQLAAGVVAFQHDGSEGSSASFAVTAEDGNEDGSAPLASTFLLTVSAQNDAPTGSATMTLPAGTEDSSYPIATADLLAGFFDADGDGLQVSNLVSSQGTVTTTPTGFAIALPANFNGLVSLGYDVIDGQGGSIAAIQNFTVAAVNDAPTGAPTVSGTANVGQVLLADPAAIADHDGLGTLSFQWLRDGTPISTATAQTYTIAPLDSGATLAVIVSYVDAQGTPESVSSAGVSVAPAPSNSAPVISSNGGGATATIVRSENAIAVTTVTASDSNAGQNLTYSIAGGADAARFSINAATGVLIFASAPDFETPADAGADNIYDVMVSVSDGVASDTQALSIQVTNVGGATINGNGQNNTIGATSTVAGQPFPTDEEDTIRGGGGNDTISALGGNDSLFGDAGNDRLIGGAGNDILDGGAGNDSLDGGAGDDTYVLGSDNDTVTDSSGIDTVTSTASRILGGSIENLTLLGNSNVSGIGNASGNILTGNSGSNLLLGNGGADTLLGAGGNDTLFGGGGADRLVGGAGRDFLTGDDGSDFFVFLARGDSPSGAGRDVIIDFQDDGADRIDLAAIFDGTLTYRQALAFDGIGQVRISDIFGPSVVVQVNLDANLSTSEMEIELASTTLGAMSSGDFIL